MDKNGKNNETCQTKFLGEPTQNKNVEHPLEYHIMDAKIHGKQQKPTITKQIMSPSQKVTIENPRWHEKSREIRKLANILQWHKNDRTTGSMQLQKNKRRNLHCKHSTTKSKTNNTVRNQIQTTGRTHKRHIHTGN